MDISAVVSHWPATFKVGLTTPGLWRGSGLLTVAPGSVVCSPANVTKRVSSAEPVVLNGHNIDIFVAKLVPPWFNVTIPIRGTDGLLIASTWIFARGKLRQTFQSAGFEVTEHVTWTDRGFNWNDLKRKPR